MIFQDPLYFYLLLLVPIYWYFETKMDNRKSEHLAILLNERLLKLFASNSHQNFYKKIFRSLIFTFLIVSIARPQWGQTEHIVVQKSTPIVIAVDLSNSMYADDIKPSRIKSLQINLSRFIDNLDGNPVGLVGFANSAFIASPLTSDYGALKEYIQSLDPRVIRNQGTDLGNAIKVSTTLFQKFEGEEKILILITDGEDHVGNLLKETKQAAKQDITLYTMGLGSLEGSKVAILDNQGNIIDYLKDKNGQVVISKSDFNLLQSAAELTGGLYVLSNTGDLHFDEIYADIKKKHPNDTNNSKLSLREDRYYLFLSLAMLFFLIEHFLNAIIPRNKHLS